ncbi:hypothetical protein [Lentilactobacillus senioris]|uniref:hypothetical protein n=1 Tax=Lentilactobacillus senioris TaxID=931534 RepID=UPI003D290E00
MTKIEHFGGTTQILGFIDNKVALGGLISDAGVTADKTGKKIIPAGTTVGGTTSFLDDEKAVLSVVSDATAQGVLEHEVDVTAGPADGTVIVEGYINEFRLPEGVTVSDEAKKALTKVTFFKRNK